MKTLDTQLESGSLFLHEEVLLLALRDREGTVPLGTMYQYALGGALLADLLLQGRIRLAPESKKKLVEIVSADPLGEDVLDEVLQTIARARRRALQAWVGRLAGLRKLKHRVAAHLCRRGILRADEDQVLGIFRRRIYPEVDHRPEQEMLGRINRAVLSDSAEVTPRTVALISLAFHSGLLRFVLEKRQLKTRKARIEQLINGEVTGKAVKEVVDAVQAAATIAAIIPAISST
jgi:hypothetical protein